MMKTTKNNIIDFYTNIYEEDLRLWEWCDNRHIVEREVKISILNKYIKAESTLCDIWAWTWLYSLYYASKWIKVTAYDIVPKHIKIIKEKSKKLWLNIPAYELDIENLNFEPKDKFDVVLLAWPLYHMNSIDSKEKTIQNAIKFLKKWWYLILDWLSIANAYVNEIITVWINNSKIDENLNNDPNNLFWYDTYESIEKLTENKWLQLEWHHSTDWITRFIKEKVNSMNYNELEKWINFIKTSCSWNDYVNMSEHCISIFKKTP